MIEFNKNRTAACDHDDGHFGSPAVWFRPVTFRPGLSTGLALIHQACNSYGK